MQVQKLAVGRLDIEHGYERLRKAVGVVFGGLVLVDEGLDLVVRPCVDVAVTIHVRPDVEHHDEREQHHGKNQEI